MQNPHFISRPPSRTPRPDDTADQRLSHTGRNTGNLLFIDALRRIVRHDHYAPKVGFKPAEIRERHDGLIIPAANWLNNTSDWGDLAALIEHSKLPCVMVGLGAQAPSTDRMPPVTDGTRRLLHVVAERSHSISVRGAFSAEVVNALGVKNVTVTGCPSLLWHVDRPPHVVSHSLPSRPKIAVNSSRESHEAALEKDDVRNRISCLISREAIKSGFDYVIQTEAPDLEMAMALEQGRSPQPGTMPYLTSAFDADERMVSGFFRDHVQAHFDPATWIESMTDTDAIIGTRLHGVIAGLLAGKPSVLITHDTRTVEMAQQARIPSVPAETVLAAGQLDAAQLVTNADFSTFGDRMHGYYSEFRAFFSNNDVATGLTA